MLTLAGVCAGDAVLATFAYRLFSYWLPLPLGLVGLALHARAATPPGAERRMSAAVDRITFVGHATVLIELGGVRLLTDPVLRPRLLGVIHRHGADPGPEVARRIDGVLISHLHHDHLDFPSLRRVGTEVPVVVPPAAGARCAGAGSSARPSSGPGRARVSGRPR